MNASKLISLHTAGTAMPPSSAMQSPISKRHWYYLRYLWILNWEFWILNSFSFQLSRSNFFFPLCRWRRAWRRSLDGADQQKIDSAVPPKMPARLNALDAYCRQGPGCFHVIVKESPEHNAS